MNTENELNSEQHNSSMPQEKQEVEKVDSTQSVPVKKKKGFDEKQIAAFAMIAKKAGRNFVHLKM